MNKNIILIGFMGTGKSAVGRRLAKKLNYRFVDTDAEIERVTGKSINQLFSRDGEIRFRSEEKLLLHKLAGQRGLVISTGGGMVLDKENVAMLRENGIFIRLESSPETIYKRIKGKNKRPLLNKGKTTVEAITSMIEQRREAYDIAEFAVNTGQENLDDSVNQVLEYLIIKQYVSAAVCTMESGY